MKSSQIKALDKIFAEFIQLRSNGYCANCNKYFGLTGINPCHYYVRNHLSLRWNDYNVAGLCTSCHIFFDLHKTQFKEWLRERLGEEEFDNISVKRLDITKLDYETVKAQIQTRIKEIR